jgi:hypothetical protein
VLSSELNKKRKIVANKKRISSLKRSWHGKWKGSRSKLRRRREKG